ncbi:unnamed protein product [Euphydryas editha]|uniref:Uncharacterized protein n=1 Tax=Euphydryas editha TaxID=104508 RepID=A0AAU9V4M3_EUPED|nr:unnamed protein product [Euphydryas editha]
MDETAADVSFNRNPSNSSKAMAKVEADAVTRIEPENMYYDMAGEKYLIIFNHFQFKKTLYFGYKRPSSRKGTEKDVDKLCELFDNLGYKVTTYTDLEHLEILQKVRELCKKDHKSTSCVCFAFLTHGEKGGDLFAADRPYQFRDVTLIVENGHPSLAGKPKIFFVQACRGGQVDSGKRVQLDGGEASLVIPTHADFLVLYSSVEDYLSYRDIDGSFMIQELCDVIKEYREQWDILHIITLVQRRVAFYRTTYAPSNLSIHDKKQMPETRFTLTKLFMF